VDELQRRKIDIDILVNNAGFGLVGPFLTNDFAEEVGVLQLNVLALTELTKLLLPAMVKRKRGKILNLGSTAAFQPGPFMAIYYATKAYVLSFSEAVAEELRHTGVTVTALCPGPTRTEFAVAAQMTSSRLFTTFGVADAAAVAEYGYVAMMHGRRLAIPGIKNKIVAQANRFAPRTLTAKIARMAQETR
jgi:short-subunit dehydrogenase